MYSNSEWSDCMEFLQIMAGDPFFKTAKIKKHLMDEEKALYDY